MVVVLLGKWPAAGRHQRSGIQGHRVPIAPSACASGSQHPMPDSTSMRSAISPENKPEKHALQKHQKMIYPIDKK